MDIKRKKLELIPRVNKSNNQINFSLKKRLLPKELIDKLPRLKCLKVDLNNLKFEDDFEEKWK